jgi:predicted enzyme related to lactoylglutathione lyase
VGRRRTTMQPRGVDFVLYGVRDLAQAVAFYRDTLGLHMGGEFPEFRWVEFDAGNVTLAVASEPYGTPPTPGATGGAVVALAVPDVPAAVEALRAKGVRILSESEETPVCHLAVISDPDGNHVFLHQRKDGTAG